MISAVSEIASKKKSKGRGVTDRKIKLNDPVKIEADDLRWLVEQLTSKDNQKLGVLAGKYAGKVKKIMTAKIESLSKGSENES